MAVNDKGVKHKLQFSGCSYAKYLNSTNIPLELFIQDIFLTTVEYQSAKKGFILGLEPVASIMSLNE